MSTTVIELSKQGRSDKIWQTYCSFIDLNLEDFMKIQQDLLLEQLLLLGQCELGRKLADGPVPTNVEEFRERMPLTTYRDYMPYLSEKREEALPRKPYVWACTSGRSGEYGRKWIPYSKELYEKVSAYMLAGFIFGSSQRRGDFVFQEKDTLLVTSAPPPYVTGAVITPGVLEHFPFRCIPPLETAEKMDFQERIAEGFKLGFKDGIGVFFGLGSVLVKVGEQFEQGTNSRDMKLFLHPSAMFRLVKAIIKSKFAGRPMLPKDLWSVKAIGAGGTDLEIFRDKIEYYWGRAPVEAYVSTEMGVASFQTWGTEMTFVPDMGFWEFIPEEEHLKSRQDPTYQPQTILLDQVEAGQIYEFVLTNFHGGSLVRYRQGDLIKITALGNEKGGINIPQMVFHSRADDIIDLGGFTRLTERTLAWALVNAQVEYEDWTAVKEVEKNRPLLHLYLELNGTETRSERKLAQAIHQALKDIEPEYSDWDEIAGGSLPRVSALSPGTFKRFTLEKQAAGVDIGHLKPMRMKPSAQVVDDLLRLNT